MKKFQEDFCRVILLTYRFHDSFDGKLSVFLLRRKKVINTVTKRLLGLQFHIRSHYYIKQHFGPIWAKKCCCVDLQLLGEFKTLNFASRR